MTKLPINSANNKSPKESTIIELSVNSIPFSSIVDPHECLSKHKQTAREKSLSILSGRIIRPEAKKAKYNPSLSQKCTQFEKFLTHISIISQIKSIYGRSM